MKPVPPAAWSSAGRAIRRGLAAPSAGLALLAALTAPAAAQDPCPSASGPDAEAGWGAYVDSDIEGARRSFLAALARCANDHYARTGLAYVALRDGDEDTAEGLWSEVLLAEPYNVDALVGLGLARWRAGDVEAVRRRFQEVLEIAPDHPTAVAYLERIGRASAESGAEDDAAARAWTAGDTDLALRLYEERLAADPDDGTAMLRVALIRAWSGSYEAALALLDRLVARQPGHADARLARARVRAWSGDLATARAEALEVLAVQPDDGEALQALAQFEAWAGRYDESLQRYEQLLAIAPGSPVAERHRAQTLAWADRFEASRAAYEALLARDPDDVEARLGLARAFSFAQDFDGAVGQYDAILARSPREVRALTGKAQALGWAGRLVESEWMAVYALEVDRSNASAWGLLGEVYRWQGRDAAAQEALETALDLEPTNAAVRDQLRSVNLALAPVARPTVMVESDSDGNRMLTTSLTAGWHPVPRLDLGVEGFHRRVEAALVPGGLTRNARGVLVSGTYQMRPGWIVRAGVGGSDSDGSGDASFLAYHAGVRSSEKYPLSAGLDVAAGGIHETATQTERRVRSTNVTLTARWLPARLWRVDGNVGWAAYDGSDSNRRRSALLAVSRGVGRTWRLGASFRGFSFARDLDDGYFDPDFYGVWEATSQWVRHSARWTLAAELAPGVQRRATDGSLDASLRAGARVVYSFAPGREISLAAGYSSAGLTSFATGATGYEYRALVLASSLAF